MSSLDLQCRVDCQPLKKVNWIHREAPCECKYQGWLVQNYSHTSTSSNDSKLLPKKFFLNLLCLLSLQKAVNAMLSFYYVHLTCAFKEAVWQDVSIWKQGNITYFSKTKKYCGQFYPVKHISVFIDFKLGEFFSIMSLFKIPLFLKLLLI